jgi:hypothetical protein
MNATIICNITNRGRSLEVIKMGTNNDYCLFVDNALASRSPDPAVTFRALAVYVDDEQPEG